VFNMEEARVVCDYIEQGGDVEAIAERFAQRHSPVFDFTRDLQRVGLANQTTMLSGESLAIAEEFRRSMERRYGADAIAAHFRTFDTICSATQERQDAVVTLLQEPLDVMLVVGGYNSSNTTHLAALVESHGVKAYHIEDANCVDPVAGTIRHQLVGQKVEIDTAAWLGDARRIGITAGASTPNNKVGETIARVAAMAGLERELGALLAV
jgi:4-hydroxy-3-methylbut-2-enyl diphosphate reductase